MEINKFLGGLDSDAHPSQQKEHTIRYGLNFVPMSEEGNLYSITNESGTVEMTGISFPAGFKPIGHSVLNNEIIVILCDSSNNSQFGYIVEDDSPDPLYGFYHPSGPIDAAGNVVTNNNELDFKQINPIDCVSRKLINGHRMLYFTDNKVPYGFLDLNNPPVVGSVAATVKLTFDQKIPKINVIEIIEGAASSIRPGVVQFITRYVTLTGGVTVFGLPSEIFPMIPSSKTDGASRYQGGFYEDGTITKNLKVEFANVDTKYQELEIVALYYESSSSVFKASIVGQVPISTDVVQFIYTGPDTENLVELTSAELQQVVVSYTHAKCIEQKDNTLFLSNLRDDRVALSADIQKIANKVRVKYNIENIPFSGRGSDSTTSVLSFFPSSVYNTGLYSIKLTMNQDIDEPTGNNILQYTLVKNGTSSTANITVAAFGSIVAGDTITIAAPTAPPYTGTQVAIVLTAVAVGATPLANEYAIGVDNAETASNIFTALTDLTTTTITDFIISVDFVSAPTIVNLIWSTVDVNVNGTTVTSSNVAGVTTTNFAGAITTVSQHTSTAAQTTDNEVDITFNVAPAIGDTLIIGTFSVPPPAAVAAGPGISNDYAPTDPLFEYFTTGFDLTTGLPITSSPPSGSPGISSVPGFTDYTSEYLTANTKGYRRGEVYSLGFKILWKDGTMSPAFHIPGHKGYPNPAQKGKIPPTLTDAWPTRNDGTTTTATGYVGTYVSEDTYSLDQDYPGDDIGDDQTEQGPAGIARNIRHHYMPNLEAQPHYTNISGSEFIRVLGLDFVFTQPIPASIIAEAEEIIFLRERRNTDNNKSIHSQGVVHKHMILCDGTSNDGFPIGSGISGEQPGSPYSNMRSSYFVSEIPFFNLSFNVFFSTNFEKNGAETRHGVVAPQFHQDSPGASYGGGDRFRSEVILNQVMYHSPESNLLTGFKLDAEKTKTFTLVQEMKMLGEMKKVNFAADRQKSNTGTWIANEHYIDYYGYLDLFCDYNKVNNTTDSTNTHQILEARYLEPNVNRINSIDPVHPALKTGTLWNQGGLQLLLDSNIESTNDESGVGNGTSNQFNYTAIKVKNTFNPDLSFDVNKNVSTIEYQGPTGDVRISDDSFSQFNSIKRSLYNLTTNNLKQYGQINNAAYITIGRKPIKDVSGNFISNYTSVYGGDTFITKYSFNAGILVPWEPFYDDGRAPINQIGRSKTRRSPGYSNSLANAKVDGWDFRTCTYYFVESNINTHYRHRPADELKQDYFPNEPNLSVLLNNWYPYLDNIKAYNTQYSYENNVVESFLPGSTNVTFSEFENRTIYSEKAAEDDTLDAYRSFLVKDFYDLPSEKGPIWDTFVEYNTLFMHTPKALWKTFAETQATIKGGNIADAVLGTSSLFARPAQEVLETEGGYGGSISQFGGAHTQLGYIFVDVLQGKIFLLGVTKTGGTVLNELSKAGISTEMHKNLPLGIIKDTAGNTDLSNITSTKANLIDNPYLGIGITSGYDYKLSRYIIVKFPVTDQSPGFTLSYSKDVGKWFNYHSYKPNVIIPYNNRLFFVDNKSTNSSFHEMNIGPKGSYFGTVYNSELTYVIAAKGQTCIFNNIVINSVSTDKTTGIKQRDDNFKEMTVYNQKVNTGPYEMVPDNTFGITLTAGQVSIKHRNDEYRIAIPRDSVKNNSLNIFDPTNLDNTVKFREKIKGNYAIVNLKYDNTADLQFVINFIKNIFTNNFR